MPVEKPVPVMYFYGWMFLGKLYVLSASLSAECLVFANLDRSLSGSALTASGTKKAFFFLATQSNSPLPPYVQELNERTLRS